MESVIAATAGVAKLFMQDDELGKVLPGYYADCILVDGNPLEDIAVLQKHDKLDVIMINGRIHKSSPADFAILQSPVESQHEPPSYNFVTIRDELGKSRVGHLDLESSTVHLLSMASGSILSSVQQVIELENEVVRTGETCPLSSVKLLPPIADRDVLFIGSNYTEHVNEYKRSEYGSQRNENKGKQGHWCCLVQTDSF